MVSNIASCFMMTKAAPLGSAPVTCTLCPKISAAQIRCHRAQQRVSTTKMVSEKGAKIVASTTNIRLPV